MSSSGNEGDSSPVGETVLPVDSNIVAYKLDTFDDVAKDSMFRVKNIQLSLLKKKHF